MQTFKLGCIIRIIILFKLPLYYCIMHAVSKYISVRYYCIIIHCIIFKGSLFCSLPSFQTTLFIRGFQLFNFIRTIRQYYTSMIPYVARIILQLIKSLSYAGIARFMLDSSFKAEISYAYENHTSYDTRF